MLAEVIVADRKGPKSRYAALPRITLSSAIVTPLIPPPPPPFKAKAAVTAYDAVGVQKNCPVDKFTPTNEPDTELFWVRDL